MVRLIGLGLAVLLPLSLVVALHAGDKKGDDKVFKVEGKLTQDDPKNKVGGQDRPCKTYTSDCCELCADVGKRPPKKCYCIMIDDHDVHERHGQIEGIVFELRQQHERGDHAQRKRGRGSRSPQGHHPEKIQEAPEE